MKKLIVLLFIFLLPTLAIAGEINLRKTDWGISKKEVIASNNNAPHVDEENFLIYECTLFGLSCLLRYEFTEDKLTSTSYLFKDQYANNNNFINDYMRLKDLLNSEYGVAPAKRDIQIWSNDLYKNKPKDRGLAISLGHLMYGVSWVKNNTEILLLLSGSNGVTHNALIYRITQTKPPVKEEVSKKGP